MQSFVIFYKSSWIYTANIGAEFGTWDRLFVVLSIGVVSTDASLDWFDLAKTCWAFLQEQKFDTIVVELE